MKDPAIRFNELLKSIAADLYAAANRSGEGWKEAVATRVYSRDGQSGLTKVRIRRDGGAIDSSISPPIDWIDVWDELWTLRDESVAAGWYGITLRIDSKGSCKVDMNYDENCVCDPSFFDS